uniref:Uncharacterized protein n=1 Tax=Arundo donax TaxID=35708 RepID=A0A0A8ZXE7_ARUDO
MRRAPSAFPSIGSFFLNLWRGELEGGDWPPGGAASSMR